MNDRGKKLREGAVNSPLLSIVILVVVTVVLGLWFMYGRPPHPPAAMHRLECSNHLKMLGLAMQLYAHDHQDKFPPPEKWCDALLGVEIEDTDMAEQFQCPAAVAAGDQARCHYAMNPNAAYDSEPNVVLLFDSRGGWNLHGGPELMVTDRHPGGSCVLLADGSATFVQSDALDTLNWGKPVQQTDTMEKEKEMAQLQVGDKAPAFTLLDQDAREVSLADFAGKNVLVYFYPRADTPGCTVQACSVRDTMAELKNLDVVTLGISPDEPEALKKFDEKYSLGFRLLSDPDHTAATAYGVWGERTRGGRTSVGMTRSSFLVDEEGKIVQVSYGVKPADTVPNAMAALKESGQ